MGEVISSSQFDYLWIQFYNNNGYELDPCSLGLPGDAPFNYNNWTSFIATTPSNNAVRVAQHLMLFCTYNT